jgi:hypothetical protein
MNLHLLDMANLHLHLLDMANLNPPYYRYSKFASTNGGCGIYSSPYCGDGNRVTAHPNIVDMSTTHHSVIYLAIVTVLPNNNKCKHLKKTLENVDTPSIPYV